MTDSTIQRALGSQAIFLVPVTKIDICLNTETLDSDLLHIGNLCLEGPHHYHAKALAEHLCTQHHIETDTHANTLSTMVTQMGDIK